MSNAMDELLDYEDVDAEAVKEQLEADKQARLAGRTSKYDKIRDLREGENALRIFPGRKGDATVVNGFFISHEHSIGNKATFRAWACPRIHQGRPCKDCQQAAALAASKAKPDQDRAKKLLPQTKAFFVALDRDDEAAGPGVYRVSGFMHERILKLTQGRYKCRPFDPTAAGCDVLITRNGTGADTTYDDPKNSGPCPMSDSAEQVRAWFDARPDMTKQLRLFTASQIEELKRTGQYPKNEGRDGDPGPTEPPARANQRQEQPRGQTKARSEPPPADAEPQYDENGDLVTGQDDEISF